MSGSTHWVSGSYDQIAEELFLTDFDTFYLEFDDTERQGGFDPLWHLNEGSNVVLGLVSTKRAELEDIEDIKKQVMEAADDKTKLQITSIQKNKKNLAISPQCGFSSSSLAGGKDMTPERMWEKLVLVRDAARQIWQDAV